jgi:AraC family transcriptional activator of pobA
MLEVPTYSLYGEAMARRDAEFLHCETIPLRSRLHGFHIRPHRHAELFQVLFMSAGTAEAVIDGAGITLAAPCLLLVPALVIHGYRFSNLVDGLVLTGDQRHFETILAAAPELAERLSTPLVARLADRPDAARTIAASLGSVAAECAGHAVGRLAMSQAHLAIACVAAHRAEPAGGAGPTPAPRERTRHVERFRDMVDVDFRARRPLDDYARRLGVTPTHLRRLCRARLGATPLAVLNRRIVLEAKRLLAFSSLGVKEIAEQVGFADPAYFSRFFQRETGLTPSAFRAMRQTTEGSPPAARPARHAGTAPGTGRRDA